MWTECSCSQILNFTQHVEDDFELKKITGVAFVDVTAAYDTVNHRLLVNKNLRFSPM